MSLPRRTPRRGFYWYRRYLLWRLRRAECQLRDTHRWSNTSIRGHIRDCHLPEEQEVKPLDNREKLFASEQNANVSEAVMHMMQELVYRLEKDKGWYDTEVTMERMIANLHSEVSEMFKAWRDRGFSKYYVYTSYPECSPCRSAAALRNATAEELQAHPDWKDKQCPHHPPKPEGFAIEMADVLIRLFGDAERCGVNLFEAFVEKMLYNWTRPYRHGRGLDKP